MRIKENYYQCWNLGVWIQSQKYSKEVQEEILILMDGLEPRGDDMLQALYETGMLEAKNGKAFADNLFEIPKLFRIGLGLVLRGRP